MRLNEIRDNPGSRKAPKRVGRGIGSGTGKTATKGQKGQKSRSGYSRRLGFEGGQMPLIRRVPKRGFNNIFRKEFAVLNLVRLNELEGETFSPESLLETGVIKNMRDGLKILGDGEITRAVQVTAHRVSAAAKEKIEAAGGSVTLIAPKPKPEGKLKPRAERG